MDKKRWLLSALILVILTAALTGYFTLRPPLKVTREDLAYTDFLEAVEAGQIQAVTFRGRSVEGNQADKAFTTQIPQDPALIPELRQKGVKIEVAPLEGRSIWLQLTISFGPILLLLGVLVFFFRKQTSGRFSDNKKLKAKNPADLNGEGLTFKDIAGIDEAKAELEEIVAFLKAPKKFSALGGKIPKGVLLIGSPGTGKTMMAQAIAGEAGVPFFSLSGSDFVEIFVGVGAKRVRGLFTEARKTAPCIIFIDEIDALGRQRSGSDGGGGQDEREQTLNQLLVELDGFDARQGIILIGATNRPDILDKALLRPGRFDRQVVVPLPDLQGRMQILAVHMKGIKADDSVDLKVIAKGTPGFSGADLANLINEAVLVTARSEMLQVTMVEMEMARDKVLMGAERKSMTISDREKKIIAYHEAGHTLAAMFIPEATPVHKVSIIPRGMALGVTMYLPNEEKINETRKGALASICTLLAGRIAEEREVGDVTSGAANDLARATAIARKMVCEWGMGENLGLRAIAEVGGGNGSRFRRESDRGYSEVTANKVDIEMDNILEQCYDKTAKILDDHRPELHRLAEALMARETLSAEDVNQVVHVDK